jgi:hypothetical protein
MNGFIKKAAAGLLTAGTIGQVGCTQYRAHVDPCWFERYGFETRQNVWSYFDAQAANGHMLDQTIWNWAFVKDEKGMPTADLSPAGQERLKYLVRRRPHPDPRLFLQTANDFPVDIAPAVLAEKRPELDAARTAAIQRYVAAITAGRASPVAFDIAVHDPAAVGLPATAAGGAVPGAFNVNGSYPQLISNFQGAFGIAPGFTLPVGAGGAGGGGAAGGGAPGAGGQGQGQGQQGGQSGAPGAAQVPAN